MEAPLYERFDPEQQRRRAATLARQLVDELGFSRRQAATQMGVSYSYVCDLLNDPDGTKKRARRGRAGTGMNRPYRVWAREEILEALRGEADRLGRAPRQQEYREAASGNPNLPAVATIADHCGSWGQAIAALGYPAPPMRRPVEHEDGPAFEIRVPRRRKSRRHVATVTARDACRALELFTGDRSLWTVVTPPQPTDRPGAAVIRARYLGGPVRAIAAWPAA